MSPSVSQMRIRSENMDVKAQNPCTKSRAGSIPLCKLPVCGNNVSLKSSNTIRLHFENVNGLSQVCNGCQSQKVTKLRRLWSKLDADVVSLVETQINPSFPSNNQSLHYALFRNQLASYIHNNNSNELINHRQQGGVLVVIRGQASRHATATGSDPTGLGRWNYIDLSHNNRKVRIISAY